MSAAYFEYLPRVPHSTLYEQGWAPHISAQTLYDDFAREFVDFTTRSELNDNVRLGFKFRLLPRDPRFLRYAVIAEKPCRHCEHIEATRPERAHHIPCIKSSCADRCLLCIVACVSLNACCDSVAVKRRQGRTRVKAVDLAESHSSQHEHQQKQPSHAESRRPPVGTPPPLTKGIIDRQQAVTKQPDPINARELPLTGLPPPSPSHARLPPKPLADASDLQPRGPQYGPQQGDAGRPPAIERKRKALEAVESSSSQSKRHELNESPQGIHERHNFGSATVEVTKRDTTCCETKECSAVWRPKEETPDDATGELSVIFSVDQQRELGCSDMIRGFRELNGKIFELQDVICSKNAEIAKLIRSRNAEMEMLEKRNADLHAIIERATEELQRSKRAAERAAST